MKKHDELSNPNSCMMRAGSEEMCFVLLARDPAAPFAIYAWITERIRIGKNKATDPQIREAFACAAEMERQFSEGKKLNEGGWKKDRP